MVLLLGPVSTILCKGVCAPDPVLRKPCAGDAIITRFPTPGSDDLEFALSAVDFPGGSSCSVGDLVESSCNVGDLGLILGSGRPPGKGNGNPLQYSCLENSMDRGAWWAPVHGIAKKQTWLSSWHFDFLLWNLFRKSPFPDCYLLASLFRHYY